MINCEFENGNKASLRHITVDVILVKDNKVLLGKRGSLNGKPILESGKWGLPGGFMERDETLSESIKRETFEETGYKIKNLQLLTIVDNPNRPKEDRQNVNFVYIAEVDDHIDSHDSETTELKWFDLDDLPEKDLIAFDFYDNLELYKKYLKENLILPIIK